MNPCVPTEIPGSHLAVLYQIHHTVLNKGLSLCHAIVCSITSMTDKTVDLVYLSTIMVNAVNDGVFVIVAFERKV